MKPNNLTKIEERFGVIFLYTKALRTIKVHRLSWDKKSPSDKLDEIDTEIALTKEQFHDECTCWCDRNAA